DLIEAEAERIGTDGHLAGLRVEVERGRVERGPGAGQREGAQHVVAELVARTRAFAATRNGIASARRREGRGRGRNRRQGEVGQATGVAPGAQPLPLGVARNRERGSAAVRVNE